ncbi:MAG: hypothetical protein Q4D77_04735 [Peptostreptococcaceae bacterium]|nr:hypothetical protein [Peptostreptococcaceae bacterium]
MKRWIALCLSALLLMGCSTTNNAENKSKNEPPKEPQSEQKDGLEKEPDLGFYFKDGEIFYVDLNKNEPKQLTEDFADEDTEWNFRKWPELQYMAPRVFFPDKGFGTNEKGSDEVSFNIYCRDLMKKDSLNMLVDEDVLYYEVGDRGEFVTYQKVNDDSLYQWHDGKIEVIGEDLPEYRSYNVSKDGKRIVFYDKEGKLYFKEPGKEKELIDQIEIKSASSRDPEGILAIEATNSDLSVILYQKKENGKRMLYQKSPDTPSVPLGELHWGWHNYAGKEAWYVLQVKERVLPLSEFVEDDLKEDPHRLREKVKNADEKHLVKTYRFWYLDNKEYKQIDGEFFEWDDPADKENKRQGNYFFYRLPKELSKKVKLSEYRDINDISYAVHEKISKSAKKHILIKGGFLEIGPSDRYLKFNKKYTVMRYYEPTGDYKGDLYQREIHGDQVGEAQKIFSNISMNTTLIPDDKDFWAYITGEKGVKEELFVDGKMVDSALFISSPFYDEYNPTLYYETSDPTEPGVHVLKAYKNGEIKVLTESLHNASLQKTGKVLYLSEMDKKKGGKLSFYDGEKSILIDQEVDGILRLSRMY